MISKCAESAILDLWDRGLKPTVRDIVRLNAVGLRREHYMRPPASLYQLRRCAFLSSGICFREPLLGHEIWVDRIRSIVDLDDVFTSLTLDAFICGVDLDELPDPESPDKIKRAVSAFAATCSHLTSAQIAAAVLWCKTGADWAYGERPAAKPIDDADDSADEISDPTFSFGIGIIRNGIATGVGVTFKEALAMPRHVFEAMVFRRARYDDAIDRKRMEQDLDDDFTRTLDEITERLESQPADAPLAGASGKESPNG